MTDALHAMRGFWHRLLPKGDLGFLVLAMLTMASLLAVVEYLYLDHRHLEDLGTHARIVARSSSAAAVFDSPDGADDALRALEAVPNVVSAQLRRPDGSLLARYARARQDVTVWQRHGGQREVDVEVVANGATVASLRVAADRGGVWQALAGLVSAMVGVMTAAVAFAHLVSRRMRAAVRDAEDRTRYLAHHDPLTGLANRASFSAALARAVTQANKGGPPALLLCLDVDNFKQINDTHGHAAGDLALQRVADLLRLLVREGDMVARLGGDEFALLLVGSRSEEIGHRVAQQLLERLPSHPVDGLRMALGVSIGMAVVPRDAQSADDAMQCADVAMYQAKRSGKGDAVAYTPELGEAQRERLGLERDLREALAAEALSLAYQPIFDGEGRLRGLEALARWEHPVRGLVSPAKFIPVAEESGLIVELSLLSLTRARKDLDAWRRQGLATVPVAMNVSARQLRREEDRARLLAHIKRLALTPQDVEFELTESVVFEDLHSSDSILVRLQAMGYTLAIDDFGTGYSSLAYLRRIRCRKLKIDRMFVDGIDKDQDNALMVESILRVAHSLGMLVVAEGVEREVDRQRLRALGCDLYQGFGLARPETADRVAQRLAAIDVAVECAAG